MRLPSTWMPLDGVPPNRKRHPPQYPKIAASSRISRALSTPSVRFLHVFRAVGAAPVALLHGASLAQGAPEPRTPL